MFGEIQGHKEGDIFKDRKSLSKAQLHRPSQAGICGSGKDGAESIVVSGGYEDDEDYGSMSTKGSGLEIRNRGTL
jgi:putative restriction endonuclease